MSQLIQKQEEIQSFDRSSNSPEIYVSKLIALRKLEDLAASVYDNLVMRDLEFQ